MYADKGLARADHIYRNREAKARELKASGKTIIGYFCCYPPAELITASGCVPHRITGDVKEPVSLADNYVETILCPFVRSCFDIALKGRYDFLDGVVVPHSCDCITKIYDIWQYYLKPPYSHFINVPHTTSRPSLEFFTGELHSFKRSLERLTGVQISADQLQTAIVLHNKNRALVRDLYGLKKLAPPLLSAGETLKVLVANMVLPVEEANDTVAAVIEEVQKRRRPANGKRPRLMIYGPQLDDTAYIDLIEDSGADVVVDDLCVGARAYWHDVKSSGDPIADLARYYLEDLTCPRTYRLVLGSHGEDLENRFGYLRRLAEEYRVNGVIYHHMRYCDTFGFQAPDARDYLEKAGFPILYIEDEYSMASQARLKTRFQAFVEMIGH